jgi:hypothetical protein
MASQNTKMATLGQMMGRLEPLLDVKWAKLDSVAPGTALRPEVDGCRRPVS